MRIWLLVSLLSLFVMLAPFIFEGQADFLDFSEGGGAMVVIGFLLAVTGFITAWFYRGLAKVEDEVRRTAGTPSSILHGWTYSPEEWADFVDASWHKDRKRSISTWKLIALVSLGVSPIIAIVTGDIPFTAIFVLALLAFLSLFAFGAPLRRRAKLRRSRPEVLLSRQGLLVGDALHPFDAVGSTLRDVDFKDGWVTITYSAPTRTGYQDYSADVWVPERLQTEVAAALETLFRAPSDPEG